MGHAGYYERGEVVEGDSGVYIESGNNSGRTVVRNHARTPKLRERTDVGKVLRPVPADVQVLQTR